jgi:hypothetical protein
MSQHAAWAHAVGVVCLIAFAVMGFGAIVIPTLDEQATTRATDARADVGLKRPDGVGWSPAPRQPVTLAEALPDP